MSFPPVTMGRHAGVHRNRENAYRLGCAEWRVKRELDLIRAVWLVRES
jgi:hypothetical protein